MVRNRVSCENGGHFFCAFHFFFIYLHKENINFMFKIIACINKNRCIGKQGELLYHIGNDLANFKRMTNGNVVIMGRKTYESLPIGGLSNRINIVITHSMDFNIDASYDNVYITHSIDEVCQLCEAFFSDKELFVIGGAEIYKQFLEANLVDEMRLTLVNDDMDGDSYFPEIDSDKWFTYYKSMAQVGSYNNMDYSFYYQVLKNSETYG